MLDSSFEIPKIEDDLTFEKLIKEILKANNQHENVSINGRLGQKQDGVDIFYRNIKNGEWIGVQCKVRSTNKPFPKNELLSEIEKAKNFNPKLSKYYIYTTLSRDKITQEFAREIDDELRKLGEFSFEMLFWEEIKDLLRRDECKSVYYRYYNKFFEDNLSIGQAIGKLVNLTLGVDKEFDTGYELIIGKIPRYDDDGHQVDYYRGTYFVVNLSHRKIEFFKKLPNSNKAECFLSDIMYAFVYKFDAHRISKWIESFENFDDFIYDDESNYFFSITAEERRDYISNEE